MRVWWAGWLVAGCAGGEDPRPIDPGRVLEGPLLGTAVLAGPGALWLSAPGLDGDGVVARLDRPGGATTLADASWTATADGAGGVGGAFALCPDLDGDGEQDLVIGAPDRDDGGAWLVSGPLDGATTLGGQPFATGIREEGHGGASVACGDVDGDGLAEVAVGAPDGEGFGMAVNTGSVGLFRLDAGRVDKIGNVDTTWSNSHLGFRTSLSIGVDLDGDGLGDLAVGGWGADKVHVVPGPLAGSYDTNSAGPSLDGDDGESTGWALATGDFDGDGVADLLIGAPGAVGAQGAVWVMRGPFDADSAGLLRNRAHRITGVQAGDQAGFSVAAVPDLDGDGDDELLIGAPFAGGVGPEAGAAYLVLGPGDQITDLDLADALLLGAVARGRLGWSVSAGDVDLDGSPELIVGAPEADVDGGVGVGAVYGWPATVRGTSYPDAASLSVGR